jgi:NodT family efflux transporter outer membrane factor (OMF) lipoprotein
MKMPNWRRLTCAWPLWLAGCAQWPAQAPLPAPPAAAAAPSWNAPLPAPAGGASARTEDLRLWWARFEDPLLVSLLDAAQQASPTLSAAGQRIAQARSARVAAGADSAPVIAADAQGVRGRAEPGSPTGNRYSAAAQASWEIDLFGAGGAATRAAQARLDGAVSAWHDARIAVAAETAQTYVQLRACEAQAGWALRDSRSREETARLTALTTEAGFRAPADAALARGSAAQGRSQAAQIQAQCDRLVKVLVALTARAEPELRQSLQPGQARLPEAAPPPLPAVPGDLLRQRPDLARAEREIVAAAADLEQRAAQRLPQVRLGGQIGLMRLETRSTGGDGSVWAVGPLSVSLPLFDAGRRDAATTAARAAYEDARNQYLGALRRAVREVEDALVLLDSAARRGQDVRQAAQDLDTVLKATEARWQGGLASQFELEDARRNAYAAASLYIDLQRERLEAAIALYRALGGGWQPADVGPDAPRPAPPGAASAQPATPPAAPAPSPRPPAPLR